MTPSSPPYATSHIAIHGAQHLYPLELTKFADSEVLSMLILIRIYCY